MGKITSKDSTDRFGYEWKKYNKIIPEHEFQFRKWVYPLTQRDFKGKTVLDAGCGAGRNSYWALKYGAKKVIGIDYDSKTIDTAAINLASFPNFISDYESIYDIDYQNYFDISMSIGVIHHLEKPEIAINSMIRATKKGGKVVVWVYGYEGNEWIVKYINPIRKVTSKLPFWMTNLVSYFFSIPLLMYVKLFRQRKPYLKQLAGFKFWRIHNIVLDQLIPKIARYLSREEALSLFKGKLKDIKIYQANENSWTVIGTK